MGQAISILGHHHHNSKGARKQFQGTMAPCKCKLRAVTSMAEFFEETLQCCLWSDEAVLCTLMHQILIEGGGISPR